MPALRCFNSRTPCGVRPGLISLPSETKRFQFTHPVRGATRLTEIRLIFAVVSIHAPRAGCDPLTLSFDVVKVEFQFTHPVRGATSASVMRPVTCLFQFTHPVRGATIEIGFPGTSWPVSIHAPRAGCDNYDHPNPPPNHRFNSRTPCGVRLVFVLFVSILLSVSIHAPRAGCD